MFETYQQRCREKTSNNFHLEDVVYCGGRTVFVQSLKRSAAKIMTREALGSSFDSKLSRVAFIIAVNSSQSASFRNNITVGKMTFYQFQNNFFCEIGTGQTSPNETSSHKRRKFPQWTKLQINRDFKIRYL